MSNQIDQTTTSISIDLKKNRIRIFKSMIHQIGDPKHIQLLVNPSEMKMAVRAVDKELPNGQTVKVNQHQMNSENSFEIYSMYFIRKLVELTGQSDYNGTYRISGTITPCHTGAIFDLTTIKKVEI